MMNRNPNTIEYIKAMAPKLMQAAVLQDAPEVGLLMDTVDPEVLPELMVPIILNVCNLSPNHARIQRLLSEDVNPRTFTSDDLDLLMALIRDDIPHLSPASRQAWMVRTMTEYADTRSHYNLAIICTVLLGVLSSQVEDLTSQHSRANTNAVVFQAGNFKVLAVSS